MMVLMTVEITQMNGFVVRIDCGFVSMVAMNLLRVFLAELLAILVKIIKW